MAINNVNAITRAINEGFMPILEENAAVLNGLADTEFSTVPAALGQNILTPITPILTAVDIVPGVIPIEGQTETLTNVNVTFTKQRAVKFFLSGDDYMALESPTPTPGFVPNSLKEAMRVARNEIAVFGYALLAAGATSAIGTAGSDPFAAPTAIQGLLPNWEQMVQYLNDSLAPLSDRFGILSTTAYGQLSQNPLLIEVQKSGNDEMLRQGMIGMLQGIGVNFDQLLAPVTVGTAENYLLSVATAVGDATLTLKTGTGTILPGDIVQIAGDATNYVAGLTPGGFAAPGVLTLSVGNRPGTNVGYVAQINAINAAVTVVAAGRRLPCFHSQAMKLAVRPTAMPPGGDMAKESAIFMDPKTGLAMRLAYYEGYLKNQFELQYVYGGTVTRPELSKVWIGK
jgi:hypothetical protein